MNYYVSYFEIYGIKIPPTKNILKHPAHYTWDTLIVKRLSESKKVSFLFLNECIVQYTILSTLNHMQLNTHQLFLSPTHFIAIYTSIFLRHTEILWLGSILISMVEMNIIENLLWLKIIVRIYIQWYCYNFEWFTYQI